MAYLKKWRKAKAISSKINSNNVWRQQRRGNGNNNGESERNGSEMSIIS
jgi:hypothetical protein